MARRGLSSKSLREVASEARTAARARAIERAGRADADDPEAAQVAQRAYNAIVETRRTGESGDVSPLVWGPLVVAAELMAQVVVKANRMPETEETYVDVAAYFVAGFISGGHGFDIEHFEQWRRRSSGAAAPEIEPG